jgi:ATP-binding cassette, subfamily B (MDR/TAP), member 1
MEESFALRSVQGQAGLAGAHELASEVVSGIRTILSFNAEERTMAKYKKLLEAAYEQATKKAHVQGVALGGSALFIFCIFSLGFWYGGQLVLAGEMTGGAVLTVFISVIMSAMAAGQLLQILPDLSKSRASGAVLFDVIERQSSIESLVVEGGISTSAKGEIKFANVDFAYPQRPDAPVMKRFSLKVKEGQAVALVGKSGAGKSTAVAMLQRFYDPIKGEILLDGVNIKDVDIKWLRNQIGYVSQEPILFSGTVSENIRFGKETADDAAVEEAARNANAHEFISKLPDGYNTNVGERGLQLSGGQKQSA